MKGNSAFRYNCVSNSHFDFSNWSLFSRTQTLSGLAWAFPAPLPEICSTVLKTLPHWFNLPPASSLTTGLGNFTKARIILKWQLNIFGHFTCLGFQTPGLWFCWLLKDEGEKKIKFWSTKSPETGKCAQDWLKWRNCYMKELGRVFLLYSIIVPGPLWHLPCTCEMADYLWDTLLAEQNIPEHL